MNHYSRKVVRLSFIISMFLISSLALGADVILAEEKDAPPQEAPYVEEENEFNDANGEIQAAEVVEDGTTESTRARSQKSDQLDVPVAIDPQKNPENETKQSAESKSIKNTNEASKDLENHRKNDEQSSADEIVQLQESSPNITNKAFLHAGPKSEVKYVHHPQSANGLIAITKSGAYVYKTEQAKSDHKTGTLRIASMQSPSIKAVDGTTFDQMYSGPEHSTVMYDHEWHPFEKYGKLGLQMGFGLFSDNGNGRFASSNGLQPKEKYTFLAVPLNLGVVYRLEWMNRQWFAPYVAGGGSYIGVVEFRDDGKSPNFVATPGFYGAGGLMFNISATSRETAFNLSSEYGINNLWVTLEYRRLQTVDKDIDFSSDILGAGIAADY